MNPKSSLTLNASAHHALPAPATGKLPGPQNPAPAAPSPRQCEAGASARLWSEGPGLEAQLCNLLAAFAADLNYASRHFLTY